MMGSSSDDDEEPPAAGPGGQACRRTTDAPLLPHNPFPGAPPPPTPRPPTSRSGYFRGSRQPFCRLLVSTERGGVPPPNLGQLPEGEARTTRASICPASSGGPLLTGSPRYNYCSPSVPTTTEAASAVEAAHTRLLERAGIPRFFSENACSTPAELEEAMLFRCARNAGARPSTSGLSI
ncbi:hypothetical protein MRX96_055874 [Rhipicephalus microplus]